MMISPPAVAAAVAASCAPAVRLCTHLPSHRIVLFALSCSRGPGSAVACRASDDKLSAAAARSRVLPRGQAGSCSAARRITAAPHHPETVRPYHPTTRTRDTRSTTGTGARFKQPPCWLTSPGVTSPSRDELKTFATGSGRLLRPRQLLAMASAGVRRQCSYGSSSSARAVAMLAVALLALGSCRWWCGVDAVGVPPGQRNALQDLWNATGFSTELLNWGSGDPCANAWSGVGCLPPLNESVTYVGP